MTANEYKKNIIDDMKSAKQNIEKMLPFSVIVDIVSEIEAEKPADYGRTYQEKAAAESMKQNILETIKERVKYE